MRPGVHSARTTRTLPTSRGTGTPILQHSVCTVCVCFYKVCAARLHRVCAVCVARLRAQVTDVGLLHDDDFLRLVKEYAADHDRLDRDFAAAWYRLVSQVRLDHRNTPFFARIVPGYIFRPRVLSAACRSSSATLLQDDLVISHGLHAH